MVMLDARLILLRFIGLVMLSILFGIGATWCWMLWNLLTGQSPLPERPLVSRGRTPWSSGSVLIVILLWITIPILFQSYVWLTRGSTSADTPAMAKPIPAPSVEEADSPESVPADREEESDLRPALPVPGPPGVAGKDARKLSLLELMSIQAAVFIVLIVLMPLVLRCTSGARLLDLGLSLKRWGRQVAVGVAAVLFLLPIIFGTQYVATKLLGPFDEQSRHPVERMLREHFSGGLATLALVTAVVLAPVCEEMLFRGIFQSWLIGLAERLRSSMAIKPGEPVADPTTFVFPPDEPGDHPSGAEIREPAELTDWSEVPATEKTGPDAASLKWLPEEKPLDMPGVGLSKPTNPPNHPPSPRSVSISILLTSFIFGGLHYAQWPAPIPIFLLALGLGLVYHRTGSLITVICMHAVFNASSTLALIYALMIGVPGTEEEKVPPPAIQRDAPEGNVKPRAFDVDRRPD
jgi:membrane protease YdiL (CAAX protease family)